jgi:hypothetical protein
MQKRFHYLAFIFAAVLSISTLVPAYADRGDKAGWSVDTDPRKRVFLKYVPSDDGPRLLVIGCLRDVDGFVILSDQEPTVPSDVTATLTLVSGAAKYAVRGEYGPNGIGVRMPGFSSELRREPVRARREVKKILPVLEGKGPIVLTVGSWSQNLPTPGLAELLGRFKTICLD